MAYSREFGAFTDLRQSVPGDSAKSQYGNYYTKTNFNPVRSDNMFSWGITSEFIFKQKGSEYFSLKYFWGRSENSYESIYSNKFFHLSNTTVAYHHEKLFASVQISQLFSHSTLSLGLGYRLGNERIK